MQVSRLSNSKWQHLHGKDISCFPKLLIYYKYYYVYYVHKTQHKRLLKSYNTQCYARDSFRKQMTKSTQINTNTYISLLHMPKD